MSSSAPQPFALTNPSDGAAKDSRSPNFVRRTACSFSLSFDAQAFHLLCFGLPRQLCAVAVHLPERTCIRALRPWNAPRRWQHSANSAFFILVSIHGFIN
jgi:hypothetical protein